MKHKCWLCGRPVDNPKMRVHRDCEREFSEGSCKDTSSQYTGKGLKCLNSVYLTEYGTSFDRYE